MQSSRLWSFGATAALAIFSLAACSEIADGPTSVPVTEAAFDNGAPGNGLQFHLNIIGVSKNKTVDMTGNNGHRIFVPLTGKVAINLVEGDFGVIDANGTDKDGATFSLPDPDVDGDGILDGDYSVYVRPLGKPGGIMKITTCAELIADLGEVLNRKSEVLYHEDAFCSIDTETVTLERKKGKSTFMNVTDQLLTIVFEIAIRDDDGMLIGTELIRIPLFDDRIENEFWEIDNNGLKLAQVRFYAN